ncbi:hypothetical protein B0H16DRAFT_1745452 [Mycena metata]|uniref:Uncharacterized protein n=1 Tax=Mycena metata TaxID=1033252 RepID=A0AAD7MD28_9AGAR|nr:hypothetical protein B0H16DRAFT_1745452 [Mycena metata]
MSEPTVNTCRELVLYKPRGPTLYKSPAYLDWEQQWKNRAAIDKNWDESPTGRRWSELGQKPVQPAQPAVNYDVSFQHDQEENAVAADRGVEFSADGRRRQEFLLNVTHKKHRLEPTQLDDRLAFWIPVPEDQVDTGDGGEAGQDADDSDSENGVVGEKRKRYNGSIDPMGKWRPEKQIFMDALLWHDGLGDHDLCCELCGAEGDVASEERVRLLKCTPQTRNFFEMMETTYRGFSVGGQVDITTDISQTIASVITLSSFCERPASLSVHLSVLFLSECLADVPLGPLTSL